MLDGLHGMEQFVLQGECGLLQVVMPKVDGVTDGDCTGEFVQDSVTAIVLQRWSNVEAFMATILPQFSHCCFRMNENTASCGSHGCCIEVELSKEAVPSHE